VRLAADVQDGQASSKQVISESLWISDHIVSWSQRRRQNDHHVSTCCVLLIIIGLRRGE